MISALSLAKAWPLPPTSVSFQLAVSGLDRVVVASGVSANRLLREQLDAACAKRGIGVHYPELHLCTDNGAIIAMATAMQLQAAMQQGDRSLRFRREAALAAGGHQRAVGARSLIASYRRGAATPINGSSLERVSQRCRSKWHRVPIGAPAWSRICTPQ